jgi:hypothetical protein
MARLESQQQARRLRCPECHDPDALACQITRVGEGVWVTLLHQFCDCDPYTNWDDVWEQARDIALDDDTLD